MPQLVKVIYSDQAVTGKGTEDDPVRTLPQLFTLDGRLIYQYDQRGEKNIVMDPSMLFWEESR